MAKKQRVDEILVERGLADDIDHAKRLVMAGEVRVEGQLAHKPSMSYPSDSEITLKQGSPYVSRGGEKLAAALEEFSLQVSDRICADVGASTGGFTDVLLQHGARKVFAIDVGYGLLDWTLRQDERVQVMERINARYLYQLPEPVSLITMDVSFISLKQLLPVSMNWFSSVGGDAVCLVKPQFEAHREEASAGEGVIQDPGIHRRVLNEVARAAGDVGYQLTGVIPSPLRGPKGNLEFLAWFIYPGEEERDPDDIIAQAVPGLR